MSTNVSSEEFARPSYNIIDQLFASTLSWQEVVSETQRFQAASALLAQVDLVGGLSLEVMATEEHQNCSIRNSYNNYSMLQVDLSRKFIESSDGAFIFEGKDVKVRKLFYIWSMKSFL
jgi:hypothetical protein